MTLTQSLRGLVVLSVMGVLFFSPVSEAVDVPLANPSFENGGWWLADGWTPFAPDATGGYGLQVVNSPVSHGWRAQYLHSGYLPRGGRTTIFQYFTVPGGAYLDVSADIHVAYMVNAHANVWVDVYDANYQQLGSYASPNYDCGPYSRQWLGFQLPATARYAYLHVLIRATENQGHGTIYIDNVRAAYY